MERLHEAIREMWCNQKEILAGLGKMYAAGGEFTTNIDNAGGHGTAEFINRAIEEYVK